MFAVAAVRIGVGSRTARPGRGGPLRGDVVEVAVHRPDRVPGGRRTEVDERLAGEGVREDRDATGLGDDRRPGVVHECPAHSLLERRRRQPAELRGVGGVRGVRSAAALVLESALLADGTLPSEASSMSAPFRVFAATLDPETALLAMSDLWTAPVLSWLVPTLFFGRLTAAYDVPPSATHSATYAMTFARRWRTVVCIWLPLGSDLDPGASCTRRPTLTPPRRRDSSVRGDRVKLTAPSTAARASRRTR